MYLFKLQKKPNTIERKDTWKYNPFSPPDNPFSKNKELTLFQSDYTDTRSEYTIRYTRFDLVFICETNRMLESNTLIDRAMFVTSREKAN